MKVLFIHEVNYLTKVIFEMHEYPELFALHGDDVAFYHYPEAAGRSSRSWRSARQEIAGRVHPDATVTLITPPTFGGSGLERFVAPLLAMRSLRREIRSGKYDAIVLYAVPTFGWQAVWLGRRLGVPVLFRALDVSHQIRRSIATPLIKLAEKYVYKNADVLSANNPALAEYCVEFSGRTGEAVVNVPPIDLSHFEKPVTADLHASLGLGPDSKVVLYMGTFFDFSGLDAVLDAMVGHFAAHPELRLVLVGGGELDASLRARVTELGLEEKVIFTGVVPYARLPEYLKLADVAINPFRPQLLTHVALPHKVLQYMAAGVPTVSTALRGLRGVIGEASGVTWAEGPEQVADAAVALAYSGSLQEAAEDQLACVTGRFSKEAAVESFRSQVEALRYHASHE